MKSIPISKFKATCLAVLEEVHTSGEPVLVTKRGEPIAEVVPPSRPADQVRRFGVLEPKGRITGDLLAPPTDAAEWEALQD